jgi:sulfate/thiosulfate transport system permease protein
LIEMDRDMEEAAASLGAGGFTIFRRIIFPNLLPGLAAGVALAFARALGEYGSVLLFAGGKANTTVASILIGQQIEQGNETGAAAVSIVLLAMALICLLIITLIQRWGSRHERAQGAGAGGLTVMPMSGDVVVPESPQEDDDERQ